MAKVVGPAVGTQFDPLAASQQELSKLGLVPTEHNTEFSLTSQTTGLNEFSNIDLSQYDNPPSLYSNDAQASSILNEMRAQNQGAGEQFLKGVGRVASTAITEIFKVPGYIGGALVGTVEGNFIENTVDNAWVNAFQSLDENIKESMPIYLTKEVEEGGIGRKLMSSAWWSTTGADGIGFLLSMYAPGKILGALGSGLKLAQGVEAIANSSKLGAKLARYSTLVDNAVTFTEQGLKVTGKGVNKLESLATVATNTFVESAAEAANTFDNVKETYMRNNPNATEEEAKKVAGDQAASVMKANIAVLALSNYFDELTLFNGFGKGDAAIKNSVFGKLTKDGVIDFTDLSKIEKYGFRQWASKELPLKVAGAFAKEGLFEEGLQTKIQQHYEKKAAGETGKNFFDDVIGDYFHSLLSDPEMQEAVVLGGILGGGAGVIGSYSDMKNTETFLRGGQAYSPNFFGKMLGRKPREATKGFLDLANENFIQSTRSLKDIAELDDQGNIKFETKQKQVTDPATGQVTMQDIQAPIINQDKLKNLMEEKSSMLQLVTLHSILSQAGEVEQAEVYKQLIDYARFTPFIQQEGGYEVLEAFIKSGKLTELEANQVLENEKRNLTDAEKQDITNNMLKQAKLFKDTYDEVNRTFIPEKYVKPDDKEQYNAWKQTVFNRKLQNLLAYKSYESKLEDLKSKYDPNITDDDLAKTLSPEKAIDYRRQSKLIGEFTQGLSDSKETYLKLSDVNGLREDYEQFKKDKEDSLKEAELDADAVNKRVDTYFQDTLNKDQFIQAAKDAGYTISETVSPVNQSSMFSIDDQTGVFVEDTSGNKATLISNKVTQTDGTENITYQLINDQGVINVSDNNGNFTKEFIAQKWMPVNKSKLDEKIKKTSILEQRSRLLQDLQLLISYRNENYNDIQKELDQIDEDYNKALEELKLLQDELAIAETAVNQTKANKSSKRNQLVSADQLKSTIQTVEYFLEKLNKTKDELTAALQLSTVIALQYNDYIEKINNDENFDLANEIKLLKEDLNVLNDINKLDTVVDDLNDKIVEMSNAKYMLELTYNYGNFLFGLFKLKSSEAKKALEEIKALYPNTSFGNDIENIYKQITTKFKETDSGQNGSLLSQLINSVTALTNSNPNINPIDILDSLNDIVKPYEDSLEKLQSKYGLSVEHMNVLKSEILVKNTDILKLKTQLNELIRNALKDNILRKYIPLKELTFKKYYSLYTKAEKDRLKNLLHSSQKRNDSQTEIVNSSELHDFFVNRNLPKTMFASTGISVEYDNNGKDVITPEGYPKLNDNENQKNWFHTIDKLASTITNYKLKVVKARWDNSDEIQSLLSSNNVDVTNRGDNDKFIFLVDAKGNYVKTEDGKYVFTSLSRSDRLFPLNKRPRVNNAIILNEFLEEKFNLKISGDINYNATLEKSNVFTDDELRILEDNEFDKTITIEQLLYEASAYAKTKYDAFYNELADDDMLPITDISKGYPVYQVENGSKKQFKVLDSFDNLTLTSNEGTSALKGAELKVAGNTTITTQGEQIQLRPGTIYLQEPNNGAVYSLNSRKLNDNEAKVIMYLLSTAANVTNLDSVKVNVPNHSYTLNGKVVKGPYNLFFKNTNKNTTALSFIDTLIHYGLKNENAKGQIYIQSGKVFYTTFDGKNQSVLLTDLQKALEDNTNLKYNQEVNDFYNFLLTKNFNVNSNLLASNDKFAYPKYTNNAISFDTSQTYYSFLFDNVVTTTATKKEGYPSRLQRNIFYGKPERKNSIKNKKGKTSTNQAPQTKPPATPPVVPTPTQQPTPIVTQTPVVNKPLTTEDTIDIHINGLFRNGFMYQDGYRFKGSSVTSPEKIEANVNRDLRSHFDRQNFNGPPTQRNAQVDEDGFMINVIDNNFTMYTYGLRGVDREGRDGYFSVSITIPNTIPVTTVKTVMKNTIDNFAKEMVLKYKPGFSDINRGLSALNLALDVTKDDFNSLLSRVKDEFTTAKPVESVTPTTPVQQEEPSKKPNPIDLYEQAKKNRASGVTLNKRKSADKIADPEIILERYINNNIIQKNCK